MTRAWTGMVAGTIRITPLPNRRREVVEILQFIEGPVRAQPGCAAFRVCEEHSPERAVLLLERWDSEAALATHVRSEAFGRILEALEISGRPADVRFDFVGASQGMELVESLRHPRTLGEVAGRPQAG